MTASHIHRLVAESSRTTVDEWAECPGPSPGTPLSAWFVRRKAGAPDVYAVASGDGETVTVELIPAETDELDAFQVGMGVLMHRSETVNPDIECGVVFDGPLPGSAPAP